MSLRSCFTFKTAAASFIKLSWTDEFINNKRSLVDISMHNIMSIKRFQETLFIRLTSFMTVSLTSFIGFHMISYAEVA